MTCSYCGEPRDASDHVQPWAYGGSDAPENRVDACRSCNSRKGVWPAELLDATPRRIAAWLTERGWRPVGGHGESAPGGRRSWWESPDPADIALYTRTTAVQAAA